MEADIDKADADADRDDPLNSHFAIGLFEVPLHFEYDDEYGLEFARMPLDIVFIYYCCRIGGPF